MLENNSSINSTNVLTTNGEVRVSTNKVILVSITLGLLSLFTTASNISIIIVFSRRKKLQTVTNYFLVSLAVADIFIGMVSVSVYAVYLNLGEWPFGEILCDIYLSIDYTCSQVSVLNIVLICMDRYLTLTRPVIYRSRRSKNKVRLAIGLSWLLAAFFWIPWIFSFQHIYGKRTVPKNQCYIQFIQDNWYMTIVTAIFAYYGPVTLILILYYRIYKLILNRSKSIKSLIENCINEINSPEKFQNNKTTFEACFRKMHATVLHNEHGIIPNRYYRNNDLIECNAGDSKCSDVNRCKKTELVGQKKAAKLLMLIILAFVITWFPYDIFVVIFPFCSSCITKNLWHFGYIFCYVNSALNPICYALGNKQFQEAYREIFSCCRKRKRILKKYNTRQNIEMTVTINSGNSVNPDSP